MKKWLVLFCTLLIFSGCSDVKEIDSMAYVVAIGIDKGEKSPIKATFQFAVPLQISGGIDGEGGDGSPFSNLSVEATSVYTAMDQANTVLSKQVDISQCKLVVLSEALSREGLSPYNGQIGQSSDFRPDTYIAVCRGSASDYLAHISSPMELNPSRYYELIFGNAFSPYAPTAYLHDYLQNQGIALPYVTTEEDHAKTGCMAVCKNQKLIAVASAKETLAYSLLTGTFHGAYMELSDDLLKIEYNAPPSIEVFLQDDAPAVVMDCFVTGQHIAGNASRQELETALGSQLEAFLSKTATAYHCDLLRFDRFAKLHFLTDRAWEAYDWETAYRRAAFSVHVHILDLS